MRLLDVGIAVTGLVFLSPLLLFVALLIKLTSWGPVFYKATRIGKAGRPFVLYKFRSMSVDADKQGPTITTKDDARITSLGRLLRRTKIDELPQLINVFKGELSLVGPRPEDPKYLQYYTEDQLNVLSIKPGITSPASVAYRHEEQLISDADWENQYIEEILPAKLSLELDYKERKSLKMDLWILWKTLQSLFRSPQETGTTKRQRESLSPGNFL